MRSPSKIHDGEDVNALLHRVAVGRRFGERATAGDAFFVTGSIGIDRLPYTVTDGVEKGLSGTNSFVLLQVMKDQSWSDARFFTANQIKDAGWELQPNAKKIGLQFLVSTDDQGMALETPSALVFQVFNARDISGVPPATQVEKVSQVDVETAVLRAGFGLGDGLAAGLGRWVDAVQNHELESTDSVSVELRTRLTLSLLEIQLGVPLINSLKSSLSDDCLLSIRENPLSFAHAANDSRKLESLVMSQVNLLRVEREAQDALTSSRAAQERPRSPGQKEALDAYTLRMEALFAEREAVLKVPYENKDEASKLGALWFGPETVWFVPKGLDVSLFAKWEPSTVRLSDEAARSASIEAFRKVMVECGLDDSGDIIDDGEWHNVAVVNHKGGKRKSGSYIVSMKGGRYGQPIGTVLNKFSGETRTWTHHQSGSLTPQQRAQCKAEADARQAAAAIVAKRNQDVAAIHASEIWAAGESAAGHGYVLKKGINADGLRQVAGGTLLKYDEFKSESGNTFVREKEKYLLVPMMNRAGELRAVQVINSDGAIKSFMRGAEKKGMMFVLGSSSFSEVAKSVVPYVSFVEGVATGASLHAATNRPVAICFDAGNLETVYSENAGQLRQGIDPVLAVDNDQFFVEKGLGFLSDKLGVNPHTETGAHVYVRSGPFEVRSVSLGEAEADGEWHQTAQGAYRISFARDVDEDSVQSMLIEVTPKEGRMNSARFSNRGLQAGLTCLNLNLSGVQPVIVAPVFKSLAGRPTDWNDLAKIEGLEAVRSVLKQQGLSVKSEAIESPVKSRMLATSVSR